MTLNATDISPNQDCSSSASSASTECPKNEAANDGQAAAIVDPEQLNSKDEKSNDSTIVGDDDDDHLTMMETDGVAVCSTNDQPEEDEVRSDGERVVTSKKKKGLYPLFVSSFAPNNVDVFAARTGH